METQHNISCAVNEYMPDMCTDKCWRYWACKARYDQTQQRIADNMEQFYNPHGYARRQRHRRQVSRALQKVFVGGIPFE